MNKIADNFSSLSLLRHILDGSSDAVLVVEPEELTIVDFNQVAVNMLGISAGDLRGQSLANIECALSDLFFWEDLRSEPSFSGVRIAETEWMSQSGNVLPIEKRVSSLNDAGHIYWVIWAENVTTRNEHVENQVRLASLLQSSMDATAEGIFSVDLHGKVVNFNRRIINMWQIDDDLLLSRSEQQIFDFFYEQLLNADEFRMSLAQIDKDQDIETESTLQLRDGRYFICISKPEFFNDELIGRVFSMRDVTALKKVEIDLRTSRDFAEEASRNMAKMLTAMQKGEARLRRVINSSLIGIFQGKTSGIVQDINDVLLKLLGTDRESCDMEQLSWREILMCPDLVERFDELERYGQCAPFKAELSCVNGNVVPIMVGLSYLEGSSSELVGFVMDMTEHYKADKIKTELISVVSHELRTPLTAIRGALGLLEGGVAGVLSDGAMNLIKIAHKNSQRLSALVNDILDMEKLMSGKMRINMDRFDLIELLGQAIDANAPYAQNLGVRYCKGSCPEHAWAIGDTDRVMQVFANLMSNAAKYSHSGGVVELHILHQDAVFRIEVRDFGAGIPEEFRSSVFGKFAQADGSDTRRQGGTGLGLNITKNLVEKMGGEIGFESEVGKGTTFWFTLVSAAYRQTDRE